MSSSNYFNKKFKFKSEGCHLPAVDVFYSTANTQKHEGLQIIKSILNHVKSKLNDFQIEEWSRHTRSRNPAQQILSYLKNEIQCEFVTQAFAKFFECISAYPMVRNFEKVFQSVHLCEAPGAFIAALNHYLKLHHPDTEFRWRASTLNPYFEGNSINMTILDDRLISQTLENWLFGKDYDGDILKEDNIRSLIAYCRTTLGEVNLVTGDGSIDCLDQPESQEEFVTKLHTAEFIVSLAILVDKGSMLIKMFTFYEASSISMLYILCCCFQDFHIFKPSTSKEGNSEVYVIAIGYKKSVMSEQIIEKMIANFKDESKALLPLSIIPPEFIQQVVEAARIFMNQQVAVIESNIRTFRKYNKLENDRIKMMKYNIVEEWTRLYKIAPIREDQKILHGLQLNSDVNLNVRVHSGSHAQRMIFFHLSRSDQFQVFFDRLKAFYDSIFESTVNSTCVAMKLHKPNMSPTAFIKSIYGRPIVQVVSSKFILVSLVKFLIELRLFLENIAEEDNVDEVYNGKKFTIKGNTFSADLEYFRKAPTYEEYEKEITTQLLKFLLDSDSESFLIEGLPLFTQFLVGVVLFLSTFVFEEVHLKRIAGTISLKGFTPNGKEHLKSLIPVITQQRSPSRGALLGICDTKLLFSLSQEFYKSVIDFNNHLCLMFCSFYLNISNNS